MEKQPEMYARLAEYWPLISPPADYAEEAAFFREVLLERSQGQAKTLLELGSGGGNNASFLKLDFEMTLVDRSPGMLAISQQLNPECSHHLGDMHTIRLNALFDAVMIHDAIMYMTSEEDLLAALRTAAVHCKPGGTALICPDDTKEIFEAYTDHGGSDAPDGRGIRYLEWSYDPDPDDSTYLVDFAYLVHEPGKPAQVLHDQHRMGLFTRQTWLNLMNQAGFHPQIITDSYSRDLFVGRRE